MSSSSATSHYTVSHGPKKYEIGVVPKQATLRDLSLAVEKVIGVPLNKQKLICRGKTLANMNSSLEELNVTSKSKIMLIGKKVDEEEEKNLKYLHTLQKEVKESWLKYEQVDEDVRTLEQGFLDKEQSRETNSVLSKRLCSLSESFMKTIESIDSLELDASHLDARAKRKSLVTQINKYLNETDKCEERLKNIASK